VVGIVAAIDIGRFIDAHTLAVPKNADRVLLPRTDSVPSSVTCIAVKRQNIAKWPPRRHGGYLANDRGFA